MNGSLLQHGQTICSLATGGGTGAIAVIRVSGKDTFKILDKVFSKDLSDVPSHTVHLGKILEDKEIIDEVLATIFRGPNSYTGEDVVEISCHGSNFIQQKIINVLTKAGAVAANPGEFTLRAFLNGKMDLSQAEAVADLIASESEGAHRLAMSQLRGGISAEIRALRKELLNFASLIELELDFGEEDVEFADRGQLEELINKIQQLVIKLIDSFETGNAIKNGIPVALIGQPNVGKSTLLNALLNEERALVSEIAGTTRDTVEDTMVLDGIVYRFIDTAGIRSTDDIVENMGIQRTFEKIDDAKIVVLLVDGSSFDSDLVAEMVQDIKSRDGFEAKQLLVALNKSDVASKKVQKQFLLVNEDKIEISAKTRNNIELLKSRFSSMLSDGLVANDDVVVTNTRHFDALCKANESLDRVVEGMSNDLSGDLLAMDIRQAIMHLGDILGEITTEDVLGNIFANFCIGK